MKSYQNGCRFSEMGPFLAAATHPVIREQCGRSIGPLSATLIAIAIALRYPAQ
jgi:hypothetical protein